MIRTGITYRFKQRVTEAGIFHGFFVRKKKSPRDEVPGGFHAVNVIDANNSTIQGKTAELYFHDLQ